MKKEKKNFIHSIKNNFHPIRATRAELRVLSYPEKGEIIKGTFMTMFVSLIMGAVISGLSTGVSALCGLVF